MQVQDIMITNIISVKPGIPAQGVADLIAQHRIHAVPVVNDTFELQGIVAEGDFFYQRTAAASVTAYISSKESGVLKRFFGKGEKPGERDFSELTAKDIMAAPCVTVSPETTVEEAARLIVERSFNTLPVVKSDNMLLGIVTAHDLLKALLEGKKKAI